MGCLKPRVRLYKGAVVLRSNPFTMAFSHVILAAVTALCVHLTSACYQDCSVSFNRNIQQLVGIRDRAVLTLKSCEAMSEQMVCLERKKPVCDATSLQYVNTILNFIRPDYERTCAASMSSNVNGTSVASPAQQQIQQCSVRANACYSTFNATFAPAVLQPTQNIVVICESLDNYTMCLEEMIPDCGQFMAQAINNIRSMQMQYSYVCSGASSHQAVTECVNDTMDCYSRFNETFIPAVNDFVLTDICSTVETYSQCLNTVHKRQDCQRYTQQAISGIFTLKHQYSVYCGADGGLQAAQCVSDFQLCYDQFNSTYFPAMHSGNMDGICSSVTAYSNCVQPLFSDCGRHMAQPLASVRIMKEQFALQCDQEYQRLLACKPLQVCLSEFGRGFIPSATPTGSSRLCKSLQSYFPCVEDSLTQCKIPPGDTSVDFSRLGELTGRYCKNLLGNRVLNMCPEFRTCTSGIVLVSSPDPSALFDASTWCSYMDMSLSCVERAVNTPHCGISNDDTIKGHLTQQHNLKRSICKLSSVPPLPNDVNIKTQGNTAGQAGGSDASRLVPAVVSLVMMAVLSLVL
ncbi:uncharacterized protein [Littorina saxatilis]|uniref:uncharacterized protein isoform X2 n=1 Tax=Littorina saxatilis TaxID=31220 RepID=UPI0038B5815F